MGIGSWGDHALCSCEPLTPPPPHDRMEVDADAGAGRGRPGEGLPPLCDVQSCGVQRKYRYRLIGNGPFEEFEVCSRLHSVCRISIAMTVPYIWMTSFMNNHLCE
ncbi:hypothetical protein FIBSPDRAFT_526646 [Athelia psychrophila]|uniref:Uncharacterized protein n=1 Tax=Athelia psychrophila TaxID=1759441 RepID=A0A166JKM6_9AGAM|nr:hypothetical protein FIBSPDRAFT_526646 [Fibularhizoctonia sp. CBS 109695]